MTHWTGPECRPIQLDLCSLTLHIQQNQLLTLRTFWPNLMEKANHTSWLVAWVHTLWLALVGVGSMRETKQSVGLLPNFFLNLGGPSMHIDIQYHTASTISCPPVLIWQCWYHVPHVCNLGTMYMLFYLSIPCMYELYFLPNSNSSSILLCFDRVSLLYLILVKLQPVSVTDAYEYNDLKVRNWP